MSLSRAQMDQKIDEHFGFEARDHVEGVLSTLAEDAEHDIVGIPTGPTYGRENARPFYEHMFADLAESKVKTLRRYYGDTFMVDESLWTGRAPGKPFGIEGLDRPLSFRILHVIEFSESGSIQRENVWVDFASILQQLPPVDSQ